jgi:hypothetical protein
MSSKEKEELLCIKTDNFPVNIHDIRVANTIGRINGEGGRVVRVERKQRRIFNIFGHNITHIIYLSNK